MALRGSQRLAQRLCALQQPAAPSNNCLTGTASNISCAMGLQFKAVSAAGAFWARNLHSTAQLRTENKTDDVDTANQAAQADTFAYRPPEQRSSEHSPNPKPATAGRLTHVDKDGRAAMVNVGKKLATQREAVASAKVHLGPEVFQLVASNSIKKGDVLTVAELAGIMGAKQTSLLIPLCHNISLMYVDVKLKLLEEETAVLIIAEVRTVGPTGVEMEALTAASTAALTIYDMCKAVSRRLVISDVQLESKHGGKSGTYRRTDPASK